MTVEEERGQWSQLCLLGGGGCWQELGVPSAENGGEHLSPLFPAVGLWSHFLQNRKRPFSALDTTTLNCFLNGWIQLLEWHQVSQIHHPAKQSCWYKLFKKQPFKVSGNCPRDIEQKNNYLRNFTKLWKEQWESMAVEPLPPTFLSPSQLSGTESPLWVGVAKKTRISVPSASSEGTTYHTERDRLPALFITPSSE